MCLFNLLMLSWSIPSVIHLWLSSACVLDGYCVMVWRVQTSYSVGGIEVDTQKDRLSKTFLPYG